MVYKKEQSGTLRKQKENSYKIYSNRFYYKLLIFGRGIGYNFLNRLRFFKTIPHYPEYGSIIIEQHSICMP